MTEKKLCIFGAGGFGKEVLACFLDANKIPIQKLCDHVVFMVDDNFYQPGKILGVEVIPRSSFNPSFYRVVVAVGDPKTRKHIVETVLPKNTEYQTLIHPSATVSPWVEIGEGSIVTAGTILTCNIQLGKHTHINLNSTIGHDCNIGDYFTTAPAVNISGGCNFNECVYIGTNAAVRDKINICESVTIGMGSVVINNIEESGIYAGIPAKKIR